jgi:hypothetical protein
MSLFHHDEEGDWSNDKYRGWWMNKYGGILKAKDWPTDEQLAHIDARFDEIYRREERKWAQICINKRMTLTRRDDLVIVGSKCAFDERPDEPIGRRYYLTVDTGYTEWNGYDGLCAVVHTLICESLNQVRAVLVE